MSLSQAYCEIPYADALAVPSLTQVDGMTIVAGSPLEVEGCVRTVTMAREAARRAGRAGLGISNTVPTGVRSQGHIAGNAAAADQFDMMEIGGVAELKIDFDSMSKIAYMLGRGRTILGETGPIIGGYAGGPETCAVTLVAYHFFALLVLRAGVQHPFTSHYQTQSCTSRQALWLTVAGAAGDHPAQRRAVSGDRDLRSWSRHGDEPLRGGGHGGRHAWSPAATSRPPPPPEPRTSTTYAR